LLSEVLRAIKPSPPLLSYEAARRTPTA